MRAFHAAAMTLVSLCGLLLAAGCDSREPREEKEAPAPTTTASAASFVSTEWEACDAGAVDNPAPGNADTTRFAELLHGTWAGTRTVRDGRSLYPNLVQGEEPNAHYVLILDMKTGQGMAYEERGPAIAANAFAQQLPAASGAPGITYFYCGGEQFSAFRDHFTKVSNDPADGLRTLARVTGQPVGEGSVADAWARLRDSGFLTSDRGTAVITASVYSITTGLVQAAGTNRADLRWDMAGEYRGSPAKFTAGQPARGVEGGVFQLVGGGDTGSFLVAAPMSVPCYGLAVDSPRDPQAHTAPPAAEQTNQQTALLYNKVVIGPFR